MGRSKLRANAAVKKPVPLGPLTTSSTRKSATTSVLPAAGVPVNMLTVPDLGKLWPVWCVLAIGVWIAFSPVLGNGFVDWDDKAQILENFSFRGLGWEQIKFAFTNFTGGVCQPIGWLIQSLTYEMFGLDPWGYHFGSLVFHIVNVVLLHLLCVTLVARSMPEVAARRKAALGWICAIPVLLYAVHPLRAEPVAWASSQAYLPSVAFSLLATLAYLRAHPVNGGFRRSSMIAASVLIVLAVLSKGSAVVLPFVFLILDAYPLGKLGPDRPIWRELRTVLIEKAPVLLFCLAFTGAGLLIKRLGVEPEATTGSIFVGRVAQASFGAWFYLVKTVWPFGITGFYPRPERGEFQTPLFGVCIAGIVIATFAVIWQRKRRPWLMATALAYLVIASPYLGLVRVGIALASDRYSYAPMMAWVVLGCAGLCKFVEPRWPRPVLVAAGAATLAVASGLIALCSAQCRVWENSEHLWSQALEHAGWSSELHHYMGTTFAESGKFEPALAELHEALRIRPHYFDATYDLGVLLDRRGESDAAVAYLREADRLRPKDPMVHLSLGGALVHQGHVDEAIALYRQALHVRPNFADLHFNLGVALLRERKVDDAIDELTRAVELRPWYAEAYDILGGALVVKGRLKEAVVQYQKAVKLAPDDPAARIDLGLTLARLGYSADAIIHLREATRRDRQNPEAHRVLGAILASVGRATEAAAEFAEVLRLRPDDSEARGFLANAHANGRRL
jgi:protein O-mannosyl-transferase